MEEKKSMNPSPDEEFVILDENDGVVSRHDSAVENLPALVCLGSSRTLSADLNSI